MNRDAFRRTAARIRAWPAEFRQSGIAVPDRSRGAPLPLLRRVPCDVAGQAVQVDGRPLGTKETISDRAREVLDIDGRAAAALFSSVWPDEWYAAAGCTDVAHHRVPTASHAAAVLLKMAETGTVFLTDPGDGRG